MLLRWLGCYAFSNKFDQKSWRISERDSSGTSLSDFVLHWYFNSWPPWTNTWQTWLNKQLSSKSQETWQLKNKSGFLKNNWWTYEFYRSCGQNLKVTLKSCNFASQSWTYRFKSCFKDILLCMNFGLSKIRFVHTYGKPWPLLSSAVYSMWSR